MRAVADRDLGDEDDVKTDRVQAVIDRLEAMSKQGESYDEKGRHGWRNPIRQDTGPLLEALVLAAAPWLVLEIGTAHGLSGCYIARRIPDGGGMASIEWDEPTAQEAQANFNEAGLPVKVHCGDAMKIIAEMAKARFPERFNMVFLDANKSGYGEQFLKLKELNLLAPRCLIVADNVIDRASELQDFMELMKQYQHMVVPTECGLLVAVA